jgi:hypothetical protein
MSGLFKTPPPPKPAPLPDEAELEKVRRRAQQRAVSQSGTRQTTLVDRPSQGAAEFSRTTLG